MTCLSRLPKGSHPGFFFLTDIGCYFELDFLVTAVFCGLHHHGGTPPLLPADFNEESPDAYRLTLIAYPPTMVVDGNSKIAFGGIPGKGKESRFDLGIEMTGFEFVNYFVLLA
jgi:hypothetical protein